MKKVTENAQTIKFHLCPECSQIFKLFKSATACSLVGSNNESLIFPILPGWPLAERQPHECEWPHFNAHPPGAYTMNQSQQDTGVEVYNEFAKMTLTLIKQAKDSDIRHINPEILHQIRECAREVFLVPECVVDKADNLLDKKKFIIDGKVYAPPNEIYWKHRNDKNFDWLKEWQVKDQDTKLLYD